MCASLSGRIRWARFHSTRPHSGGTRVPLRSATNSTLGVIGDYRPDRIAGVSTVGLVLPSLSQPSAPSSSSSPTWSSAFDECRARAPQTRKIRKYVFPRPRRWNARVPCLSARTRPRGRPRSRERAVARAWQVRRLGHGDQAMVARDYSRPYDVGAVGVARGLVAGRTTRRANRRGVARVERRERRTSAARRLCLASRSRSLMCSWAAR